MPCLKDSNTMRKEMRTVSRQLLKQFPNMVVEPEKLSSTKFRVHIVLASPSWNISVCSFPVQAWY